MKTCDLVWTLLKEIMNINFETSIPYPYQIDLVVKNSEVLFNVPTVAYIQQNVKYLVQHHKDSSDKGLVIYIQKQGQSSWTLWCSFEKGRGHEVVRRLFEYDCEQISSEKAAAMQALKIGDSPCPATPVVPHTRTVIRLHYMNMCLFWKATTNSYEYEVALDILQSIV
jgi:hypothetical protein